MFTKRKLKLVVCSHNIKSAALKSLAAKLSEKVGYKVFRVNPHRVRNRVPVMFHAGIDKVEQFRRFTNCNVSAPKYATSLAGVEAFEYKRVVARKLTNASEGRGIVVFEKASDDRPFAPLYTEYIPKQREFRVHVWNKQVIDIAEKRKRKDFEQERENYVRNLANGYVFCRTAITEPAGIRDLAVSAVSALDRTYGAVDIIWNEKKNKCFVLEVNSRPGMEGSTIDRYATAILTGVKA